MRKEILEATQGSRGQISKIKGVTVLACKMR